MAKKSGSGSLMPLIVLVIVGAILAAVGYAVYTIANDVSAQTKKKMEKKNISFSRDGMKVGVKEVTREQQEDGAQSVIMKIWNNSSFPAYKSRLGWMDSGNASSSSTDKRQAYSRSGSSQNNVSKATSK